MTPLIKFLGKLVVLLTLLLILLFLIGIFVSAFSGIL